MSQMLDHVREQVKQLSREERRWLAEELLTETDEEMEFSAEEVAEWQRRVDEMRSGKDPGIPAEEVFAEMRAMLEEDARKV